MSFKCKQTSLALCQKVPESPIQFFSHSSGQWSNVALRFGSAITEILPLSVFKAMKTFTKATEILSGRYQSSYLV